MLKLLNLAMKDRGKELEAYNGDCFGESYEFYCKKHPGSSTAGICAYCLTDRLVQLVCPECGEQRLSSCSCSETLTSSNPNSSTTADVGSVGRISFLLENEKGAELSNPKLKMDQKAEDFAQLRRSNSISADVKRGGESGFWKIKRLFRRRKEKIGEKNQNDDKSEMWVSDCVGVSRSRSLCSFRGGGFYDTEESGGTGFMVSSAARASNVSGGFMVESAKRSCFSESEARFSNFDYDSGFINGPNKNIFSLKESEFSCGDDPAFIDLKLDFTSDSKPDISGLKKSGLGYENGGGGNFGILKNSGSCRVNSVSDKEMRKCKKNYKVWKWFFRQHPHSRRRDEDHVFRS